MNNQEKQCNHCGLSKPLTEFHKRKISRDGHQHKCKQCNVKLCHNSQPKYESKNGNGVYTLWNKVEQCYDYIGCGELKAREMKHRNPTPYSSSTPDAVKLNVWLCDFDNVYDFKVLYKCKTKTKKQLENIETEYIDELNPKYNKNKRKRQYEAE
jgi:hypothetical protein